MAATAAPWFRARLAQAWIKLEVVVRYGAVGLINTAFGYGLYAGLVFIGLNLFVAQILSHCTGAVFNYFMFKRHVFTRANHAVLRYVGAYGLNYILGLTSLALVHHVIASPYLAGFLALLAVAFINFFVLRFLVFRDRSQTDAHAE